MYKISRPLRYRHEPGLVFTKKKKKLVVELKVQICFSAYDEIRDEVSKTEDFDSLDLLYHLIGKALNSN